MNDNEYGALQLAIQQAESDFRLYPTNENFVAMYNLKNDDRVELARRQDARREEAKRKEGVK